MSFETTIIQGNLGKDPEMRFTPQGKAVTTFSVAVDRGYGENKQTVWYNVETWEKTAEACNQYLKKGSKVLVEGKVKAHAWVNKETGDAMSQLRLTASTVRFIDTKNSGTPSEDKSFEDAYGTTPADEYIPF